jgi:hypothetical protein
MTAALALRGCSLIELHAKRKASILTIAETDRDGVTSSSTSTTPANTDETNSLSAPPMHVQDVFFVVDRGTGKPFEDDELHDLAQSLLEATRTPMNAINALKQRVRRLEEVVKEKQIRVVPTPTGNPAHLGAEK